MAISKTLCALAIIVVAGAGIAAGGPWTCNGRSGYQDISAEHADAAFPFAHCYDHLTPDHFNATTGNRNGISPERYHWPWGRIPYVFDQSALNSPHHQAMKDGMRMIEDATCLTFHPRTDEVNYITIQTTANGCWCAGIGMRGGPQVVNLEPKGCGTPSTAAHEFLHAAGFEHEHARPDRDQYIFVDFENICREQAHNYHRCDQGEPYAVDGCTTYGEAYNVHSIMHYTGKVWDKNFSVDNKRAIMISLSGDPIPDTQNDKITKEDAAKVNKMYNNCQ